jgi:hypothetical protein
MEVIFCLLPTSAARKRQKMMIRRIATAPISEYRVTLVDPRLQALERLYERRDAVDNLIRSLQNYVEASKGSRAECVPISAGRKCL